MSISKILIAAAMLGVASASCPNDCSGKGKCGDHDMCTCYPGYQGLDCSERTCLFGRAWGDVAYDEELAHDYAECSNNGICDRKTGECTCNDGFSGDACRYSTCPNGCNGHGTCEYISEIASDTSVQYQANSDRSYIDWDSGKSRFCKCDGGWSGVDCSARMCPKGNDPLTTHTPDEVGGNTAEVQEIQTISIQPHLYDDNNGVFIGLGGDFTLTYTDAYNQEWTTRPIRVKSRIAEFAGEEHFKITTGTVAGDTVTDTERRLDIFELYDVVEFSGLQSATVATSGAVKTITAITCADAAACTMTVSPPFDANEAANAGSAGTISITLVGSDSGEIGVKRMLSELPNQVLPDSTVDETIAVDSNQFRVTFSDAANSGDQHLLKCKVAACDTDGCQPRKKAIKGIYQQKMASGAASTATALTGLTSNANFLPSGTFHISEANGAAVSVTGTVSARTSGSTTALTVSYATTTSAAAGAMTIIQTQDFTDDSVGEFPGGLSTVQADYNINAHVVGGGTTNTVAFTSALGLNQLADPIATGGSVGVDYTLTVADASDANSALSYVAASSPADAYIGLASGDSSVSFTTTGTTFLRGGVTGGRQIQVGDTIGVQCADADLAAQDGVYTVTGVEALKIYVTGNNGAGAAISAVSGASGAGACKIHVKIGSGDAEYAVANIQAGNRVSLKCTGHSSVNSGQADGYYTVTAVASDFSSVTLDRAVPVIGANSWTCVMKKIVDSPCTVVETRKGTSENYECSRRGNCDSQTGLCGCFAGYTGEDCSVQTVLV